MTRLTKEEIEARSAKNKAAWGTVSTHGSMLTVSAPVKSKYKNKKTEVPTEHQEQCAVIAWCDKHPIAKHIFAIPNGTNKSPATAAKFKREGLRAGYPDLGLDVASRGFHGLRIEMKRTKGGVISDAQGDWCCWLTSQGYKYSICRGAQEAINVIEWYLDAKSS